MNPRNLSEPIGWGLVGPAAGVLRGGRIIVGAAPITGAVVHVVVVADDAGGGVLDVLIVGEDALA